VVPDRIKPSGPAGVAVRAAIARGVRRIMLNDPHVRLGDVEALHQMRVGTRRVRSDLRTFRPLVNRRWADGLRDELKWLGGVLGDVRDLDVLLERLHRDADDLAPDLAPLFEALEAERAEARARLLGALRTARYLELLDRLVEAATSPELTPAAEAPAGATLPPLVRSSWKKLRKWARRLDDRSSDADYHRVRVLTKRARYGAEAVAPALGRKRGGQAERFADRASDIQDLLGEMQDSVVAGDRTFEVARRNPRAGPFNLAAGRLIERELGTRRESRRRYPAAWKRLDRSKRRSWM
jgi:CHAD domain-containing protein